MAYSRILIAVDESKYSAYAAQKGFELAHHLGASIAMVYVVSPVYTMGGIDSGMLPKELEEAKMESGKVMLNHYIQKFGPMDTVDTYVLVETPSKGILGIAKHWKAEMIVIGRHGLESLTHIVFGGVVDEVAKHTKIPVLLVPYQKS